MTAPAPTTRASRRGWLALAVLLRLGLAATPGYGFDVRLFRSWARSLLAHPWSQFYARAEGADHLPGDIVLHGALARVCSWLGVGPDSWGYGYALKAVPALGDLALAGAIAWLLRRRGCDPWPGAAAVLFSPALLYLSGVWGQWDSVSTALTVWALALVWTRSAWLPLAGPLAAWAVLVKPPLLVPLGLGVGVWLVLSPAPGHDGATGWRRSVLGLAGAAVAGIGTAGLLCLPFGLSAAGLVERVRYAADLWPVTTMGAPNLWMALHGSPWGPPRDDAVRVIGVVLLVAAVAVVLAGVWRCRRADAVVVACWAAAAGSYASFVLLTRAHERYAVPGVVLLGVAWALTGERWLRGAWWVATGLLLASALAANLLPPQAPSSWLLRALPFETMSLGALGVLAALLAWGAARTTR